MKDERGGPGWVLGPFIRWSIEFVERQLDAVRSDLGPVTSGISRLVVIAAVLAMAAAAMGLPAYAALRVFAAFP